MATNRKLGRTTDIRMAMLKTMTTDLIYHGKIETTLPRAKEVKAIADSIISLAIKEKDNYEMVDVKVVKAKLDSKGNKMTELVKSKNGKENHTGLGLWEIRKILKRNNNLNLFTTKNDKYFTQQFEIYNI